MDCRLGEGLVYFAGRFKVKKARVRSKNSPKKLVLETRGTPLKSGWWPSDLDWATEEL